MPGTGARRLIWRALAPLNSPRARAGRLPQRFCCPGGGILRGAVATESSPSAYAWRMQGKKPSSHPYWPYCQPGSLYWGRDDLRGAFTPESSPFTIPPLDYIEKSLWLRLPSYRFAPRTLTFSILLLFSSMQPKILLISTNPPSCSSVQTK
ncbi:hypothetical protein GGI43DRAFT_10696 [Trichoderma evansii]